MEVTAAGPIRLAIKGTTIKPLVSSRPTTFSYDLSVLEAVCSSVRGNIRAQLNESESEIFTCVRGYDKSRCTCLATAKIILSEPENNIDTNTIVDSTEEQNTNSDNEKENLEALENTQEESTNSSESRRGGKTRKRN